MSASANAQTRRRGPKPEPTPAPTQPETEAASTNAAPEERVPTELLKVSSTGLTAEQVGTRAAATSYQAKAAEATLRGAAARVDAALAQFLPRIQGLASAAKLSPLTVPNFGGDTTQGGQLVVTQEPPGTLNPTQTIAVAQPDFRFPVLFRQYTLQANITIPLSDYFLRINQAYSAATHAESAARFDAATARARSASEGRIAYYNWLRARSAIVVASLAMEDQRNHLNDAKNQFTVGNASRADVLRAETAVAAAELAVERAKNLADLTEKQVKVAMHTKDDSPLVPGESLDSPLEPVQGNLKALSDEAMAQRFELKSIEANYEAARKQATATKNGLFPSISGFGDVTYANPNNRRFLQVDEWFPTWTVGIQATWSPNDTIASLANGADLESRANAIDAQRFVTRDGIEIEVMQAWNAIKEASVALDSTKRELASASEAYRVARELFNAGRGTSTTLTDAETELTRARLSELNAKVDARIARVRLEHVLGRDTKQMQKAP